MFVTERTALPPRIPLRILASLGLMGATLCWGLCFPLMRALGMAQTNAFPECSSLFISSWSLTLRFGLAAIFLSLWLGRRLMQATRMEISQGLGTGLFTASGMLFQMDGLSYTDASISAFLTQGTCFFVPIVTAFMVRRLPSWQVMVGCVLVLAGVAVLADLGSAHVHLGRGEWETLLAAALFTGQILWIERSVYVGNDVLRMSSVSFVVAALAFLPVALITMPSVKHLYMIYNTVANCSVLLAMTLISTLAGMLFMFIWQSRVGAVAAAVIYCTEPIFASIYAFVLPAYLSLWMSIDYANETLSTNLLIGGGLIIAANLVMQWRASPQPSLSEST